MNQSGRWVALVGSGEQLRRVRPELVAQMQQEGLRTGGFHHRPVLADHAGEVVGYDVVNLATGQRSPLVRLSTKPDMCNFAFTENVFATARSWLNTAELDVAFLEAARLEARHKGHWETIEAVVDHSRVIPVVAIRPRALASIALDLPAPTAYLELCRRTPDDIAILVQSVVREVRGMSRQVGR